MKSLIATVALSTAMLATTAGAGGTGELIKAYNCFVDRTNADDDLVARLLKQAVTYQSFTPYQREQARYVIIHSVLWSDLASEGKDELLSTYENCIFNVIGFEDIRRPGE